FRRRRSVVDEEHVLVVVLELRPLTFLAQVLHRQRMPVEEVVQGFDVGVARSVEIEPEILVATEHRFDRAPVDLVEEAHERKLESIADGPPPATRSQLAGPDWGKNSLPKAVDPATVQP